MAPRNNLNQALQQTAPEKNADTVKSLLQKPNMLREIQRALPRHMSGDRMARVMLTEIRKNPLLAECEPASFMGAVMQLSQLGLEPGGHLGHAYLIPFKRSVKVGKEWKKVPEVQLVIGYRGMLDLARRSGQIQSIEARVIYANDDYEIEMGLDSKLIHKPDWHNPDRGEPLFFYAVAKLKDGGTQFEVMSATEVNAIRDKSQGYDSAKRKAAEYNKDTIDHPWATHYEEMGKKTVTRRLFKWLPVSIEMQSAVGLDEMADADLPQHNALTLDANYRIEHDDEEGAEDSTGKQSEDDPLKAVFDAMTNAENMDALDEAYDRARTIGRELTKGEGVALNDLYNKRQEELRD